MLDPALNAYDAYGLHHSADKPDREGHAISMKGRSEAQAVIKALHDKFQDNNNTLLAWAVNPDMRVRGEGCGRRKCVAISLELCGRPQQSSCRHVRQLSTQLCMSVCLCACLSHRLRLTTGVVRLRSVVVMIHQVWREVWAVGVLCAGVWCHLWQSSRVVTDFQTGRREYVLG